MRRAQQRRRRLAAARTIHAGPAQLPIKRLLPDEYMEPIDWSPDGRRIALLRYSGAPTGSRADLCVLNADGVGLSRLTTNERVHAAAWSPNGSKIAFGSWLEPSPTGLEYEVKVLTVEKPEDIRTVRAGLRCFGQYFDWSPDGAHLIIGSACSDVKAYIR